jgi:diacylglycerol kinase (ATP)
MRIAYSMTKFLVIFNPAARSERSRKLRRFLAEKIIRSSNISIAATSSPGAAREIACRAVRDGFDVIIAAGGDGTINEVVNGMFPGSAASASSMQAQALGILRVGTVNVFARELGIPKQLDAAWQMIERGYTTQIDLGCAESGGTCRYFVQLAGVGFDAWAVQGTSNRLKRRIGPLSYVWAGLKAVSLPRVAVEVSCNGASAASGQAVLIGNGRRYGGDFCLFPAADLRDGMLDVCVFENGGYVDVFRYAQSVLRGLHTRLPDVKYFQAQEFECSASAMVPFEVDGEEAGHAPVRFSVVPRALRVIVPEMEGDQEYAG